MRGETQTQDPKASYVAIATRQFAHSGYHGTSLAALAQEAGVSKQALLHFFGTKERLYAAVLTALADRLMDMISATHRPDPSDHLAAYFRALLDTARTAPDDMRLVVQALLDSAPTARTWPLKPYLETLLSLAQATPGGRTKSAEAILAWLSQMIGTIQYLAIAAPALSGMFGAASATQVADCTETLLARAIADFVND